MPDPRTPVASPAPGIPAVPGSPPNSIRRCLTLLPALLSAMLGCGGATAPCPTPITDLDRHRDESEAVRRDVTRALLEERALRSSRTDAVRRIEAAGAALDSLTGAPRAE